MEKIKIDTLIIEYNKIQEKKFNIYLTYNKGLSQTNFIIDLDSIHPAIYRTFTKRQLNILLNKLKKEV